MRLSLAIAAFFAMSGAAIAGPAEELRAGLYAHGCCGIGSSKEDGVAVNGEVVFSSPRVLSVLAAPRPVAGATIAASDGGTSQIYTGLEWRVEFSRWFVAPSVGLALHDGEADRYDPVADAARVNDTVFLGCRVLARLSGDAGYRVTDRLSASFHWNHISNAGLCSENEGLDQMGLRIGVAL